MLKRLKTGISTALRQLFWLTTSVTVGIVGIALYLNHQIFSPPKRALLDYHLERLQQPERFGLRIRKHDCIDGKAPCLLVEPTPNHPPGKRGRILRKQLAAKGTHLPAYGTVRGTIVLLHGRNGRKEDMLPVAERFVAAGFRSLLIDLPAHGDSPLPAMAFGSSTFEQQLPRRALQDARQHFALPDEPALLWGLSMGAAFAVSAARESPTTWEALIVASSFAHLDDVLRGIVRRDVAKRYWDELDYLFPALDIAQWLRGRPAIRHIQPQQWAKEVTIPTLVVHGTHDAFIHPKQGKALFDAINTQNKQWLTVPGGGHANVLGTAMPLYAAMNHWLAQHITPTRTAYLSSAPTL